MAAIGTRHFTCVNGLTRLLVRSAGDAAIVSVQNPVRLDEHTEPQPDLTVLRVRDYRESLPMPEDVHFLIEVSDTTLAYDREANHLTCSKCDKVFRVEDGIPVMLLDFPTTEE
jgi:uncharacterized protein YbaR (Trm112 family)